MALLYGLTIWPYYMALLYGLTIWPYYMALLYGLNSFDVTSTYTYIHSPIACSMLRDEEPITSSNTILAQY